MFSKKTASTQFYKKHPFEVFERLFGAAVTALIKLFETVLSSCCDGLFELFGSVFFELLERLLELL